MKLSIIIPAYNEEKTILEVIKKAKSQEVYGLKKEIIVVDDGSTDNTAKKASKIKGIIFIKQSQNRGKGFAIRTALKKVTGDIVLIQDADLELSPDDYPVLIKPILDGKAEVVYGSRLLNNPNVGLISIHYIGGCLVTLIVNILFRIHITDEPNGFKVFKTNIIKNLNLKCERYEFCPEVTAKVSKRKIKIYEVPVKYTPRSVQSGKKIGLKDAIQAVFTLLRYRFSN